VAIFLIKGCKQNQNNRGPAGHSGCGYILYGVYPPHRTASPMHLCVCLRVCPVKYAMIYASLLNAAEVFPVDPATSGNYSAF